MAFTLALLAFAVLTTAIIWYGQKVYMRPGRVYDEVERAAPALADTPLAAPHPQEGLAVKVVRQIGEQLTVSPEDADLTRRYLIAAGFRSARALSIFQGCKVVATVVLALLAFLLKDRFIANHLLGWISVAAGGLLGWFGPGVVLDSLIQRRQLDIRFSLPDALDLMVICLEAGHALDQAFVRVSRELKLAHPVICDEFGLVTLEMRAGKRRTDALHNLAARSGEPELQKLVAVMIQADRFGTSIGDALRVHADFMRIRRRQDAEEKAGQVGVKLIFPIFFFILPSMFLVTAGPGVLQVAKYLLPTLRQVVR